MRNSLIAKFIGFLLLYPLSVNSALSKSIEHPLLSNQLEEILNKKQDNLLKDLFLEKSFNKFNQKFLDFRKKYKDTQWSINTIKNQAEKTLLDIKITAKREIDDQIYNLNSKQTVEIETYQNKITNYQVINEESILSSQKSTLIVKIIAPDKVLTGERYELNLIL